jgi:hypothetical protein
MRKIKSTALLGAFVAVASVGAISHEAHGTTLTSVIYNIPKETLPSSVTLPAPYVTPSVNYPSNATVTLTLSGASFVYGPYYPFYIIVGNGGNVCSARASYFGQNSLTLSNCALTANTSYSIVGGNPNVLVVDGSQGTSSIVLSYSSNVGNDTPSSVTLAQVMPQLSVSVNSVSNYVISPSSLSTFTNGTSSATNAVVISNSAFGNTTWINTINASDTMSFLFTGIPSSVSSVSATDTGANTPQTATPGNASATIGFVLANNKAPFASASSDTIFFGFFNSGNIQPGTIVLSSITGVTTSTSYVYVTISTSYVYSSTSQNFLTFTIGGTQLYIPDALAPDNNLIQSGYITISMPSTASIASISVLNNQSVSCPTNGILTSTSTPNVYYINLATLASLCTGLTPTAWQSGVPLVINISGANATPNNITADAYARFNNMLKRIPVNVLNASSSSANFSY